MEIAWRNAPFPGHVVGLFLRIKDICSGEPFEQKQPMNVTDLLPESFLILMGEGRYRLDEIP